MTVSSQTPKLLGYFPGESLRSAIQRFVRMLRTEWHIFKEVYVDKFKEQNRRSPSKNTQERGLFWSQEN